MRSLVERWVHIGYSAQLKELGYKPYRCGRAFDSYLLTHEDWAAFRDLFDPPAKMYELDPEF